MNLEQLLTVSSALICGIGSALTAVDLRARSRRFDGQLFMIAAPPGSGAPEHFLEALHGGLRPLHRRFIEGQPPIAFEMIGRGGAVRFQIWIPLGQLQFVEALLRSAFPGIEITPTEDVATPNQALEFANIGLARDGYLPIRTEFDSEPLASLLWTLARAQESQITIQLLLKPKPSRWQAAAYRRAQHLRDGQRGLRGQLLGIPQDAPSSHFEREQAQAIEEKAHELGFECAFRVKVSGATPEQARELLRSVSAGLRPFALTNSFDSRRVWFRALFSRQFAARQFPLTTALILNVSELAGLVHFPTDAPPTFDIVRSPRLAPPPGVSDGGRLIGVSTYSDASVPVRLGTVEGRRHLFLAGPTGTGKTTTMANLASQDIVAGRGVAVLDPKRDLYRAVLERLPRNRVGDVVVIASDDSNLSVGINPLEVTPGIDPDLVAENTLAIFMRVFARWWGPRTSDILKSALLTLVRQPGATLAHIPILLTDQEFRRRTLSNLHDPIGLGSFWSAYERLSESQQAEAIGPVMNKLRDFLVRPRLRRLLCQPRSTVDLRRIVNGDGVLLVDLSVGQWGEPTSALIGSFLVAKIWEVVTARTTVPEEQRRDFGLYVDEFQNFVSIPGQFGEALAQARGLRLSLTLGAQHTAQLPRDLREAVGSNARSKIVFQCGQDDAAYFAHEFQPLDAQALISLPRFEAAARLSIRGETSRPFTLRTLPLPEVTDPSVAADALAASQARYSRHAAVIDRELQVAIAPMEDVAIPALGVGRRRRR